MTATVNTPDPGQPTAHPRLLRLFVRPQETWAAFAETRPSAARIFIRYGLPLAAIPAVAKTAGLLIFGIQVYGVLVKPAPMMAAMVGLLVYAASLLSALILAFVIDAFSAVFNGEHGFGRAMMLSVFAHAPGWIGGVFLALPAMGILPPLGVITVGFTLFGFYLLYVGMHPVMCVKRDRCPIYAGVAFIVFMGLWGAVSLATTAFERVAMVPAPGATLHTNGADIDVDRLKRAAKELRASLNATGPQLPAASPDELQSLMRSDLIAGYTRTQVSSNSAQIGRLKGSTAQGVYVKDKAVISVSVSDVGSIAGLATAVTLTANKSDQNGYQKSGEVDGRLTIEKYDRPSNTGEYDVMVGNRFLVQAKGQAPVEVLKEAARGLDFERLEAMAKG